jgi:hypothetical protein
VHDDRDVRPRHRIQTLKRWRIELEFWFWVARETIGLVLRLTATVAVVVWLIHGGSAEAVAEMVGKLSAR